MKRFKAFTILELTVVMLLTTIVAGISYGAYHIVTHQFQQYKTTNETLTDTALLDALLKRDFAQAEQIVRSENGIVAVYKNQHTTYNFGNEYIIRSFAERVDTFNISVATTPVTNWQKKAQHLPGNLIDELSFSGNTLKLELPFHYLKKYGTNVLMKLEQNSEH
jgi:Tfp pilus assembly protein PilE